MPTAVFPTMGNKGYEIADQYGETLEVYDDGSYRRYLKSSFDKQELTLRFNGISQAMKTSVRAFFNARKSSVSDSEFYIYNPEETTVIDGSGASTTGRHLAIFLDPGLRFTRSGGCRWSGSTRIMFLN